MFCLFSEADKWYCRKLEINLYDFHRRSKDVVFAAVVYSFISRLIFTAPPPNYLSNTRSKYSEVTLEAIRKIEKLSIKLQKCNYDLNAFRVCLVYRLTPKFVKFKLWKKPIKTTSQYNHFQHFCTREEYHSGRKDSLKYEKEISLLFNNLKTLISHSDSKQLQKYLFTRTKLYQEKATKTHYANLEKQNKTLIGQDYYSLRSKLIHNLPSFTISLA